MSGSVQILLTSAPLACYLQTLAVWHSGRCARVIRGRTDALALAAGLAGLLAFGPIGGVLSKVLTGQDALLGRLAVLAGAVAAASPLTRRASRRLVIYNVTPEELDLALTRALSELPAGFRRGVDGFTSADGRRAVRAESSTTMRTGSVEAVGLDPEGLVATIAPRLRAQFRARSPRPSRVAWALAALAFAAILAPVGGWFLTHPAGREAVRAVLWR